MILDDPTSGYDEPEDERESISVVECIAYIATILPELKALSGSEPELQRAIEQAEAVARKAVVRLQATDLWKKAGLPTLDAS